MKARTMPEPTSSAAAGAALGLKSGLLAGLFATVVSCLAVGVGFTIVPLKKGCEGLDAARRLVVGLFCSFTLGPVLAFKALDMWPWMLTPYQKVLSDYHPLTWYIAAAAPFLAGSALFGFWIVAAAMRWFTNREGKDIQEMVKDAKS